MSPLHQDELWRSFPRTALEFEERFASEESCRAYWIEAHWNGHVTIQGMVPRHFRTQRSPSRHFRERSAADHGVRLVQDGLDLAA
jgi:hypothetical protein